MLSKLGTVEANQTFRGDAYGHQGSKAHRRRGATGPRRGPAAVPRIRDPATAMCFASLVAVGVAPGGKMNASESLELFLAFTK